MSSIVWDFRMPPKEKPGEPASNPGADPGYALKPAPRPTDLRNRIGMVYFDIGVALGTPSLVFFRHFVPLRTSYDGRKGRLLLEGFHPKFDPVPIDAQQVKPVEYDLDITQLPSGSYKLKVTRKP